MTEKPRFGVFIHIVCSHSLVTLDFTHHIRIVWWVNFLFVQRLPVNVPEERMILYVLLRRKND